MTMMSFCRALLLSFGKTKRDDDDDEEEEEERNAGEQTFFCRFVCDVCLVLYLSKSITSFSLNNNINNHNAAARAYENEPD